MCASVIVSVYLYHMQVYDKHLYERMLVSCFRSRYRTVCSRFAIDSLLTTFPLLSFKGGAKINRIFYEKFMFELARLNTDEKALHSKIGKAILNAQGIRTGLFTPKMAFDGIVNDQITDIRSPIMKVPTGEGFHIHKLTDRWTYGRADIWTDG